MSLPEVNLAIESWQLNDELAQSPGFCRRTAIEILKVGQEADVSEPHVKFEILVWPDAKEGEDVHYAVKAVSDKETFIFNPSPTAQFPQYNGTLKDAPSSFKSMIPTPEVK